jgi:DNA-binding MarR family transcriptional regulator
VLASQKWIKAARPADLSRLSTGPPCDSSIYHITALVAWDSTYGVNTASRMAVCPRIRRLVAPGADASQPSAVHGGEPMLLYLVKQVELAVRARLDELLRPDRLTALQYTALTVLERHPDMSVAQLARNSFVTAQSMADMVAALEDRGLIERHRDQADRRCLAIALSPAGHEFLDRYRDPVNALESRMLHGTTKPQVTALRRTLTTCHANPAPGQPDLP